jgi:hypothetical protein
MSERFLVEADRKPVGVAVRGAGGFRFFSCDTNYAALEGRTFVRARTLDASVADITRIRRKRAGATKRLSTLKR